MSKKMITAIVVVVLLAGIAGANYMMQMDPKHLAERGVGRDLHDHGSHEDHEGTAPPEVTLEELMEPIGSQDAVVVVETLFDDPTLIEDLLRPMFRMFDQRYPEHLRFEFIRNDSEEAEYLIENVTGGRRVGLIINGEMIKMVPDAPLGMLAFGGTPVFEEWSAEDLEMAVEWELRQAGVDVEATRAEVQPEAHQPGHDHTGHVHGPGCSH